MPFTTPRNKKQWSLQHLEYADDLVPASDLPETGQELLTRLVITIRKYNRKIVPTKADWMHIEGGEVLETLTKGELIVRQQRVTYLGSLLDVNGDPPSAVRVVLNTVMISTIHHEAIAKSCLMEQMYSICLFSRNMDSFNISGKSHSGNKKIFHK